MFGWGNSVQAEAADLSRCVQVCVNMLKNARPEGRALVGKILRRTPRKGEQGPVCEGLESLGEELRLDPAVTREPWKVLREE